jgi:hypothetical protein
MASLFSTWSSRPLKGSQILFAASTEDHKDEEDENRRAHPHKKGELP